MIGTRETTMKETRAMETEMMQLETNSWTRETMETETWETMEAHQGNPIQTKGEIRGAMEDGATMTLMVIRTTRPDLNTTTLGGIMAETKVPVGKAITVVIKINNDQMTQTGHRDMREPRIRINRPQILKLAPSMI